MPVYAGDDSSAPHRASQAGRRRASHLVLAMALAAGAHTSSAQGQDAPQPTPLERVTVTGNAHLDDRREANVAKMIITHDELQRFGETSLAEALRRVPGLSIAGLDTDKEIRLRGLGGRYTQILLNGEPVPLGFNLATLAPNLVERIEVVRSASADSSAQGIAGSINIVLRRRVAANERSVKLSASELNGMGSGSISASWGTRNSDWSYLMTGTLKLDHERTPFRIFMNAADSSGAGTVARVSDFIVDSRQSSLELAPRATWNRDDGQSIGIDGLMQLQHVQKGGPETRTSLFGPPPAFSRDTVDFGTDLVQGRLSGEVKSMRVGAGSLDARVTLSILDRRASGHVLAFNAVNVQILTRAVNSTLQDRGIGGKGKYSWQLGDEHALAVGLDSQLNVRHENRLQRESSDVGYPLTDLDEANKATVRRLAGYVQDEWEVSTRVSGYLGVRWEGLRTDTSGVGFPPVRGSSSVASPTAQVVWKLPGREKDQVRLSLARTYRAPTANELIPRRWIVNDNTATSPNFQGNPQLRPELAWGLDIGYERYATKEGYIGANLYVRRIRDVILQHVFEDASGTWIAMPANFGEATAAGLELEARGNLRALEASLPRLNVHASLARNVSKVDAVAKPGNRLSEQPSLTATLGFDYRPDIAPLVAGLSFAFQRGDFIQTSTTQWTRKDSKRNVDVYAQWALDKTSRLRLTLSNLLRIQSSVVLGYRDDQLDQRQATVRPTHLAVRLGLDLAL